MNKPIRTISIFCLLLFLALMLNATYLQYCQAGALNEDPRNRRVLEAPFSGERGAILVGREPGRRERAVRRPVRVPADLPQPFKYAPSPAGSPTSARPASSSRRTTCSPATTPALFVTRLVDLLSNAGPRAAASS